MLSPPAIWQALKDKKGGQVRPISWILTPYTGNHSSTMLHAVLWNPRIFTCTHVDPWYLVAAVVFACQSQFWPTFAISLNKGFEKPTWMRYLTGGLGFLAYMMATFPRRKYKVNHLFTRALLCLNRMARVSCWRCWRPCGLQWHPTCRLALPQKVVNKKNTIIYAGAFCRKTQWKNMTMLLWFCN